MEEKASQDPGASRSVELRTDELLGRMTLAEKIGQMTQIEKNSITPEAVAGYAIGSVLSGGGGNPTPNTPEAWAQMVRTFQEAALQSRLGIPLLYGVDAVHGHNNLKGATIFPHNIGLGASRDPNIVGQVGRVTARELLGTNVHWDFAPAVSVPQDIRWGRTYEGYSENTELVAEMAVAFLRGLQGAHDSDASIAVLGSVKHFVGDGGTRWGTTATPEWIDGPWRSDDDRWSIDQGITDVDEATLRAVHLPPYQATIEAGALNIMVSYSSWGGLKMHAHKYLLTDVLKGELGFKGFLVSDWMAINQIARDYYTCVVTAINAGLDMIMVPFDYEGFIATRTQTVENGDVPLERVDDAVRRILTAKFALGLFEKPFGSDALLKEIGSPEHREVAREAVRKSLVLLKNEDDVVPLSRRTSTILVAGEAADDIGLQCGGWTIEWMGQAGAITPGTTLLEAMREASAADTDLQYSPDGTFEQKDTRADVGVVVLSEAPYAEGTGDRVDLTLPEPDIELVQRVRTQCEKLVVILYSGRPLIITDLLDSCDAFIAAWLPGTEGQGIADVLFGEYPFTGKLSYAWPRSMAQVAREARVGDGSEPLFPFGYGLTT